MDPSVIAEATIHPSRITDVDSKPFASGGAANVFNASYDGEPVVIKRMKNSAGAAHLIKDFYNEAAKLSRVNHMRIVRFFGVLIEDHGISLVLEKMTHGSLMGYYTHHPKPAVFERIQWALDIAYGMQYLHERQPPVVHRDLKSLNILMSMHHGRLCAKVSDFGSAMHQLSTASQMASKSNTLAGTTLFYRAPELNGIRIKFTTASDVYAYGIVLSEIASWEGPYGCPWTELSPTKFQKMHDQGQVVPIDLDDADAPKTFKDLTEECSAGDKNTRPSMGKIVETLRGMSNQIDSSNLFSESSTQISSASDVDLKTAGTSFSSYQIDLLATEVPVNAGCYQTPSTNSKGTENISQDTDYSLNSYQLSLVETEIPVNSPAQVTIKSQPVAGGTQHTLQGNEIALASKVDAQASIHSQRQAYSSRPERATFDMHKRLAEDGNADSQNWLGMQYLEGKGVVEKNFGAAVRWFELAANQNHAEAQLNFANRLDLGEGIDRDNEQAFVWFTKAAELGNAEAQNSLGICYEYGKGVGKDIVESAKWYTKSAEQGLARAQKNLGLCYEHGTGVPRNIQYALHWYTKSAEQGFALSQFCLGLCYKNGKGVEQNFQNAVKWYTKSAEQGCAAAQCNLGICYKYGQGVDKDLSKAVEWYTKSAEQGDDCGQLGYVLKFYATGLTVPHFFSLGICYKDGDGVPQDFVQAVKWFTKSAEQGLAGAQCNLGFCYKNGEGVAPDPKMAVKWFLKAADQGNTIAQQHLGECYKNGEGVAPDSRAALKWLKMSAEGGNETAQRILGICYKNGDGVPTDLKEAAKWFRMSAEQGDREAQMNLGLCYKYGEGVSQDFAEAFKWFEKLKTRFFDAGALNLYGLGLCYQNGEGVRRDLSEAWTHFSLSADGGDAEGQCNAGLCYQSGKGGYRDVKKAAEWFQKSAEQGNAGGQYNLARCYHSGYGVKKDLDEAIQWYTKSAEQGHALAQQKLDDLKLNSKDSKGSFMNLFKSSPNRSISSSMIEL
ncbi:hypothetical protein HDU97_006456 [Phlyctochytrium planicorne]|nr:hypothetical protein HDU97_006456 [Phlyctochytrium planicorne]